MIALAYILLRYAYVISKRQGTLGNSLKYTTIQNYPHFESSNYLNLAVCEAISFVSMSLVRAKCFRDVRQLFSLFEYI